MRQTTRIWFINIALLASVSSCSTTQMGNSPNFFASNNRSSIVNNGDNPHSNIKNKSITRQDATVSNDPVGTDPDPAKASEEHKTNKDLAQSQIKNFRISGKIAVQTGRQSGTANVIWREQSGRYGISIMGPGGVGAINLYGRPGRVILQTSNGKTFIDKSPEHLLAKGWGYNVPVSHLKFWIRGLPSPDMSMNTRYDNKGRLRTLIQQGWVIQYLGYTHRGKLNLPNKIFIHSPSLQVKIVIYQWQV